MLLFSSKSLLIIESMSNFNKKVIVSLLSFEILISILLLNNSLTAQVVFSDYDKIGETPKVNPSTDGFVINYGKNGNIFYVCTGHLNNGVFHYFIDDENKTSGRINIKADINNVQGYLAGVFPLGDFLYAIIKTSTPTKQQLHAIKIDLETNSLDKANRVLLGEVAGAPQMLLNSKGELVGKPVKNNRDFLRANFGFNVSKNNKYAAVAYIKNFNGEKEIYKVSIFDTAFNKVAEHDVDDGFLRAANEYGSLKIDNNGYAQFVVERYNPDDGFFEKLHYFKLPPNDSEKVLKTSIAFSGNIPARSNIFYQKEGLLFPRTKITKGNGYPAYFLRFDEKEEPIIAGLYSGVNGEYFIPQGYFLSRVKPGAKSSPVKFYGFDKTGQEYVNLLPTFWTFRDIIFSKKGEIAFAATYSSVTAKKHYKEVNKLAFKSAILVGTALSDGKIKLTQAIPLFSQAFPKIQLVSASNKVIGFFNDGEQNDGMTWNEVPTPAELDDLVTCHFSTEFKSSFKRGIYAQINPGRFIGLIDSVPDDKNSIILLNYNNLKEVFVFYRLQIAAN